MKGSGNSYTTLFRQYDPRLGRWRSLDPDFSLLPFQSPFVSMNNNPILLIDPLGNTAGDFLNQKGEKIGTDGKSDGKVYLVSNMDENIVRENNGNSNLIEKLTSYKELPSYNVRQGMQVAYKELPQVSFYEIGGEVQELSYYDPDNGYKPSGSEQILLRAKDGEDYLPGENPRIKIGSKLNENKSQKPSLSLPSDKSIIYRWHSHVNGFYDGNTKTSYEKIKMQNAFDHNNNIIGSTEIWGEFNFGPSPDDRKNLTQFQTGIVLDQKDNNAYIYDKQITLKVPLEIFFNYKSD